MLLTIHLLSKGSFLGSLINKCRQVIRIKPDKLETNIQPNISSITTTPKISNSITLALTSPASSLPAEQINRPSTVANLSLSSPLNASRKLEAKLGLPPKPKRPLTPYFRFMHEIRPKIQSANPNLSLTEIVKKISQEWSNADNSVKQRLQDEYKKEKQIYIEERTKYDLKISDEQRVHLKELKKEEIEARERRMMRKRIKSLGRPKRPSSAYLLFIAKQRTDNPRNPKETYREWHRRITTAWSALSDEQKDVYLKEAQKELEKYRSEISLWEEKMIRLGNIDVVRSQNLIDPDVKPRKR